MVHRKKPYGSNAVADIVAKTITYYAPEINDAGLHINICIDTEYSASRFYWDIYVDVMGWDLTKDERVNYTNEIEVGRYPDEECEPEETCKELAEWLDHVLEKVKNSGHEYATHRPAERK